MIKCNAQPSERTIPFHSGRFDEKWRWQEMWWHDVLHLNTRLENVNLPLTTHLLVHHARWCWWFKNVKFCNNLDMETLLLMLHSCNVLAFEDPYEDFNWEMLFISINLLVSEVRHCQSSYWIIFWRENHWFVSWQIMREISACQFTNEETDFCLSVGKWWDIFLLVSW